MSLNQEIRDLLASFNTPAPVAERMAAAMARIDQERLAPGLDVGQRAPDFELRNGRGQSVTLSERLRRGPVVLNFFRGAWCPICNLQLLAFHRALPAIREAGADLLAVHPDPAPFPAEPTDFDILIDPDQAVIRAYRLQFPVPPSVQQMYTGILDMDLAQRNSDGSWYLPVPGTFIIDERGVVRRSHVTADFTRRMEPDDVLQALRDLRIVPSGP